MDLAELNLPQKPVLCLTCGTVMVAKRDAERETETSSVWACTCPSCGAKRNLFCEVVTIPARGRAENATLRKT